MLGPAHTLCFCHAEPNQYWVGQKHCTNVTSIQTSCQSRTYFSVHTIVSTTVSGDEIGAAL